jgi:multiple sugar transport system permease protein
VKRLKNLIKNKHVGYFFIAPAFLTLAFLVFAPTIQGIVTSFFKGTMTNSFKKFVGFQNFITVLHNERTINAIVRTGIFAGSVVILIFVIGMILALALDSNIKFRKLSRTVILMPWVVSGIIAGLTWRWMMDTQFGIVNDILSRMGILSAPIAWLGAPKLVLICVIIATVWRSFPFVMINILAGLQTIDKVQYESAYLDGANALEKFFYITFPNLKPVIMPIFLMQIIWQLQNYDLIAAMTGGIGPVNSTETIPVNIYVTAFQYFDFNSAAAVGVILMVFTLLFSIIYIRYYFKSIEE